MTLPLPTDPARFRYLDVSREPEDGDPGHSGLSILRGPSTASSRRSRRLYGMPTSRPLQPAAPLPAWNGSRTTTCDELFCSFSSQMWFDGSAVWM